MADSSELPFGSPDQYSAPTADDQTETPNVDSPLPLSGVLTNQNNLREFMSRRLIVPREAIAKYYDDLMVESPGQIPIASSPFSEELIEAVTASPTETQDANSRLYPVFIELQDVGDSQHMEIIHWNSVKAVHFRSENELNEFKARKYPNLPFAFNSKISTELFHGGTGSPTAYQASSRRSTESQVRRLEHATRWTSTILNSLLLTKTHVGRETVVDAVAALIDQERQLPEGYKHLGLISNLRKGEEVPRGRSQDEKLFSVIAHLLVKQGKPHDALGFVRQLLTENQFTDLQVEQLEHVAELCEGTKSFTSWNQSDKGTPVIRGLWMLLSKEIDTLGDWAVNEAGARDQDILTGAVLLGLCKSRQTLESAIRPEDLDDLLAALERSAWLNEPDELTPVSISAPQIIDGSKIRELRIGTVIVRVPEPPASLVDLVADADLTNEHINPACIELIKSEGWGKEVVETKTHVEEGYHYERKLSFITQPGIVENELVIDKKKFVALLGRAEPVSAPATKLRQILVDLQVPPASGG